MGQKKSKLVVEKTMSKSILDKNREAVDLYKETNDILKEVSDILEQTDIALGRKQVYTYKPNSTKNCEINYDAIPPATSSYKI